MIEKNVPTSAKNDRPIIVWRSRKPVSRTFSSWNRSLSNRWRPKDFDSRIPLTLSVSSVIVVMSASVLCVLVATSRRAPPTFTVSHRNSGISSSDRIVSGIEIRTIAMIVLMIVTKFDSTVDAVSVTTDWTPPTSFASRDWISPVRVVVKNRRASPGGAGTAGSGGPASRSGRPGSCSRSGRSR